MWTSEVTQMIIKGIGETLYMVIASTAVGYLFGLPAGILLAVTDKDGIKPNAVCYKILDAVSNIIRSIPFLILLILLIPFTRALIGKSYGPTATIVSLVVAAIPFIARMVESSLKEVDAGVIEAARSMGASTFTIITKVLLVEARTSPYRGKHHCNRYHTRIFRHGRSGWRRRTRRPGCTLRLLSLADGHHDCDRCFTDYTGTDFPDCGHAPGIPSGQT